MMSLWHFDNFLPLERSRQRSLAVCKVWYKNKQRGETCPKWPACQPLSIQGQCQHLKEVFPTLKLTGHLKNMFPPLKLGGQCHHLEEMFPTLKLQGQCHHLKEMLPTLKVWGQCHHLQNMFPTLKLWGQCQQPPQVSPTSQNTGGVDPSAIDPSSYTARQLTLGSSHEKLKYLLLSLEGSNNLCSTLIVCSYVIFCI